MKNKKSIKAFFSILLTCIILAPMSISHAESTLTNKKFSSQKELEEYVQSINNSTFSEDIFSVDKNSISESTNDTGDSSTTNNQVSNVDEGDIVKTYKDYIYYANEGTIYISHSSNGDLSLASKLELKGNYIQEIFTRNNELIVISSSYRFGYNSTLTSIYDISNPTGPILLRELSLEGYVNTTRLTDSTLYIITNQYISSLLPRVTDSSNINVTNIAFSKINYCPIIKANSYTNIMKINLDDTNSIELESLLGNNSNVYMSAESLFLGNYDYNSNKTIITKYDISNNKMEMGKSGIVNGSILNQFSMDEYNDTFRVATTSQTWANNQNTISNSIFIFDYKMNIVGYIDNIAPNERIYSVRFNKEIGYVVTFKNIDPLFTIDLSNPTQPTILGELKVPGYSSYLHIISEDLVLGIGRDIQDLYIKNNFGDEIRVGTREGGIKLSLFNVSDPNSPVEIDSMILGSNGSYSEVLYNHKALMVNNKNNDFAFIAQLQSDNDALIYSGALIVGVNKNEIMLKSTLPLEDSSLIYQGRVVYIGNELFVVTSKGITSYDYSNFKEISTLKFN